ncbi:MAG: hypothetical protein U0517_01490 [Candidatus Andersenbacteria bacterium]
MVLTASVRRTRHAIIGLVAILGLVGILVPQASQAVAGLGARPAYPLKNDPHTESIFIHTLSPGASVGEGVNVINSSDTDRKVLVYATDSAVSSDGAFTCAQRSEKPDSVGAWLDFGDKREVTVASHSTVLVPFTIKVPDNATVGEHEACVVVEESKAQSTSAGIHITTRSGIRVSITVPGDVKRSLEITDMHIDRTGAEPLVSLTVTNGGNVSEDLVANVVTRRALFGNGLHKDGGQFLSLSGEALTMNFPIARPRWGGWVKISSLVEIDGSGYTAKGDKVTDSSQIDRLEGADFGEPLVTMKPWDDKDELALRGPVVSMFVMPDAVALSIYSASLIAIILLVALFLIVRHYRKHPNRKGKAKAAKSTKSK